MADDTQKSIFDAFSGSQNNQAVAPQTTPQPSIQPSTDTPLSSSSQDKGASIFSAFNTSPEKPDRSEKIDTQLPQQTTKDTGNIFSSFSPESELEKQQIHEPLKDNSDAIDSNAPWYKKLWQEANAPLFDAQTAKNWFGWDVDHWNGWGKGVFDLAAGLTSPLSIALTIGTFGAGSVFESAGAAALKGVMSAEDIAQVTKGSEILTKALRVGAKTDTAYAAMADFGIDPIVVKNGLESIAKAGLNPEAMMANGLIRRTGGAMLRGAGVDAGLADKVSNFAQFAADAGFTAQNAYGVAIAAPQALDAIKEGDYERAKQLGIDALGSGAFAFIGGKQLHQHAGELMTDAEAASGLRVKPSEENLKLIRLLEPMEGELKIAGEREKAWKESSRDLYKDINTHRRLPGGIYELKPDKNWIAGGMNESDLRARMFRESDGKLDLWHNMIAKAADRDNDMIGQLDPNISSLSMVAESEIKNKPTGYIDQLLKATDSRLLTDREKEYSKHTGLHFDETGARAVAQEALGAGLDSYVTRIWKDPENDSVRKFKSLSSAPDFSVNTSMARHRVFEHTIEGILKGYELADHDMISLAAYNGNEFSRIVAERKALARIRGAGARASDGRPMAALSGSGHLVESYDEQGNPVNPAVVINPQAMQNIRMANKTVEGFRKNIIRPGSGGVSESAKLFKSPPDYSVAADEQAPISFERGSTPGYATLNLSKSGSPIGRMDIGANHYAGIDNAIEIKNVRIPPELQRQGHGTVLYQEAANYAQEHGADYLISDTKREPDSEGMWKSLQRKYPDSVSYDTDTGRWRWNIKEAAQKIVPAFTELDKLIKEGKIARIGQDKKGQDIFAWTTRDYKTIDNPSFRGWKVPTVDTDGNPVFVQGELKAHPEAEEYLNRRFGVDQGITKKIPGLQKALGVTREAKGVLLAFSPFHFVQEGLRALMTGISPFTMERFNPENPMHVLATEKGVWEMKDYRGVKAFEDGLSGHSRLISKIPVLREIQHWSQEFLFDKYIPALKLRAFSRMYEANKALHPEWTKEKLGNESADEVNERFGGIPYKRIGRSAATMDVARLTTLAPDWLESEMRFMKRTFMGGAEGAVARRDVLKMTLGLWATARVLNYLVSGQLHNEAPFGLAYKDDEGREKVYSVRTMPTDMLHAVQDPLGFMNGRVAPLVKTGIQTYTGRDEFGRKMDRNGIFVNMVRNVAPIGIQGIVKTATGQDTQGIGTGDQVARAAGLTVYPYRTEAQKLVAQLASDHTEAGPVDKDKLRRHQGILELEDRVRQGKIPVTDVYKAVEDGNMHVDEARKMLKNLKETEGMDPDTSKMYLHATRLPMADLINVWEKAGNEEKAALSRLIIKKKQAYLKKSFKEMSPAERNTDKTYQWIKRNFPTDPLGFGETTGAGATSGESASGPTTNQLLKFQSKTTGNSDIDYVPKNPPVIKGVKVDSIEDAYKVFEGRPLNDQELKAVSPVFKDLLDLGKIKVHDLPESVLNYFAGDKGTLGAGVKEIPNNIFIANPGVYGKKEDERAVIGHEVTHQYQALGGKYHEDGSTRVFGNNTNPHDLDLYDYGTPKQLDKLRSEGKRFSDMTDEQQAKLVQDYIYYSQKLGAPDTKHILKSIQPYVNDLISSQSFKQAADKADTKKEENKPNMLDQLEDTAIKVSRWLNRYF